MAEQVAYRDRQPYIDQYEDAARLLCYGGAPETRGRLLPHGGALRQLVVGDQDVTHYWLAHEQGPDMVEDFPARDISKWNLDYTLRTMVTVNEIDDSKRSITPYEFVAELCESLGEEPGDQAVIALGTAITLQYENYWLDYQKRRLAQQAQRYAGRLPAVIEDPDFRELAVDVPLREANIGLLRGKLLDDVRLAHNIARTGYDPIRDMALMTLTGKGNAWGEPYMTTDTAMETLGLSTASTSQAQGESR